MPDQSPSPLERPTTLSKIIGFYQALLRRHVEHFFPEAVLDTGGDTQAPSTPGRSVRGRITGSSTRPAAWASRSSGSGPATCSSRAARRRSSRPSGG